MRILIVLLLLLFFSAEYKCQSNTNTHSYFTFSIDNKFGIIDSDSNIIQPFVYDLIRKINDDRFILLSNNSVLLYSTNLNRIIDSNILGFKKIFYSPGYYCLFKKDSVDILDSSNNFIFSVEAEDAFSFDDNLILIVNKNKFGLMKINKNIILTSKYDMIYNFSIKSYYLNFLLMSNDKWHVNKLVFLDNIENWPYMKDIILFSEQNKIGICNLKGEIIAKPEYDWVWSYSDKMMIIKNDKKWGFIDNSGRKVVPARLNSIGNFSETTLQSYIIKGIFGNNVSEKEKNRLSFIESKGIAEGKIRVKINNKWGFIDEQGNIIAEPQYEEARNFSNGYAAVKIKNRWGYIDSCGKIFISPKFQKALDFTDCIAFVKIKSKWGIIDKKGKLLIKPKYKLIEDFLFGRVIVKVGKKYGFIDKNGSEYPIVYDSISSFSNHVVWAKKNDKWGLIDNINNVILDFIYDDYNGFYINENGFKYSFLTSNYKVGLIDINGNMLIKPIFSDLSPFLFDGYIVAERDSLNGLVDLNGNTVIPFKYAQIRLDKNNLIEAITSEYRKHYYDKNFKLIWQE